MFKFLNDLTEINQDPLHDIPLNRMQCKYICTLNSPFVCSHIQLTLLHTPAHTRTPTRQPDNEQKTTLEEKSGKKSICAHMHADTPHTGLKCAQPNSSHAGSKGTSFLYCSTSNIKALICISVSSSR